MCHALNLVCSWIQMAIEVSHTGSFVDERTRFLSRLREAR
jgi:hypothetical protein